MVFKRVIKYPPSSQKMERSHKCEWWKIQSGKLIFGIHNIYTYTCISNA